MPIRKKRKINGKIIALVLTAILAVLMIISFAPAPNVTEIVLFP